MIVCDSTTHRAFEFAYLCVSLQLPCDSRVWGTVQWQFAHVPGFSPVTRLESAWRVRVKPRCLQQSAGQIEMHWYHPIARQAFWIGNADAIQESSMGVAAARVKLQTWAGLGLHKMGKDTA